MTAGPDRPALSPIGHEDIEDVSRFLQEQFSSPLPVSAWRDALSPRWSHQEPNRGFLLRSAGRVVGVYTAYYARRTIGGRDVTVCNLADWCVVDEHRSSSLLLLRALLKQEDMSFTDVTAMDRVADIESRLGFTVVERAARLVPNLPWPGRTRRVRIVTSSGAIAAHLTGAVRTLFEDHRSVSGCHHVLALVDGAPCLVTYRIDKHPRLGRLATVLSISASALFEVAARPVLGSILRRHGVAVTVVEEEMARGPRFSRVATPRRRLLRSDVLAPHEIDYLYTELVFLGE